MSLAANGVIYQTINPDATLDSLVVIHETFGFRQKLREALPPTCKIIVIFSQGTDGSTDVRRTIPEIAAYYLDAVDSLGLAEPYVLMGFSIGGMIAFEMAQQLAARGLAPKILAMVSPSCGTLKRSLFGHHLARAVPSNSANSNRAGLGALLRRQCQRYSLVWFVYRQYWRVRYAAFWGKPLPKDLIWIFLTPIFRLAARRYKKRAYTGNIVIAYEKDTAIGLWLAYFKGETQVLANLDCSHYELVETDWAKLWLDKLHIRGNEAVLD